MAQHETALPFDILSFPRDATEEGILIETDPAKVEGEPRIDLPAVHYLGANAVDGAEPDAGASYCTIAQELGLSAKRTMLLSDRATARSALAQGMGVATVDSAEGVATTLDLLRRPQARTSQSLYERPLYTDLSYKEIAEALYTPGQIRVVGFVGRTGAGKSTTIDHLVNALDEVDGRGGKFEVDAFFVRSRKDRRAWLNESGISDEERAERQRVITWWDLDRTTSVLSQIKEGQHVE